MTPKHHPETRRAHCGTPLGDVILAYDPEALVGLYFDGQKHQPGWLSGCERQDQHPLVDQTRAWLGAYFAGGAEAFVGALSLPGTPFQRAVWQALQGIPPGGTRTYSDIARAIGSPLAVRAVGAAVGRNPISIILPCHRVVGADGSLTGYAGGLARKQALLQLERRA